MVRIRAPELSQTVPWLNCHQPLSLKTLRGKIVLLDFWTYGCINCLHVIPDLHYLQEKYAPYLTVIGIHTAKFDYEQTVESVEQAIARYAITHPVVVDCDRTLWDQYAIRAYPTFVLIDPQGYIVTTISGEGRRSILDHLIQQLIAEHRGKGSLDEQSLAAILQSPSQRSFPLAFPSKVFADATSDTLFIADTGHHRLVMTTLNGTPKGAIGSGIAGWQDGSWDIAQFSTPQGMAFDPSEQILYIADADNHLIRQICLRHQTVTTIAGTGNQNRSLFPQGGKALDVALNSPWDLVLLNNQIYIAMAGSHQIWTLNLNDHTIQTLIGTGAESCVDGTPGLAAFAQPHGIATDGTQLFVADSETSSIRAIELAPIPIARTLCGQGHLFRFGDQDGTGSNAQLQHCSGLLYAGGWLWVADTYNNKIKQIDPVTGACSSIAGNKLTRLQDGVGKATSFWEPAGLAYANNRLYVADTNNHVIRWLNLASLEVQTLLLPGLCSPYLCT